MRKVLLILLLLIILAAGAFGGRRFYRHWKKERAVTQAREAFAKPDYDKGLLWLQRALMANGNHVEAVRMMVDFAVLIKSPAAVTKQHRRSTLDGSSTVASFLDL